MDNEGLIRSLNGHQDKVDREVKRGTPEQNDPLQGRN